MSVSSMAGIAAVRDQRTPKRGDAGRKRKPADDASGDTVLKYRDSLVAAVPTEIVGPYTILTAMAVSQIGIPTKNRPSPPQYLGFRWWMFVVMVVLSCVAVWLVYLRKRQGRHRRFPAAEVVATLIVASAWGLTMPDSPFLAELAAHHVPKFYRIMWPAVVAIGAVTLVGVLWPTFLTQRAKPTKRRKAGG